MKKMFILLSIVTVVSLSSCKKEYTCECVTSSVFDGFDEFESDEDEEMKPEVTTIKNTKKKAKEECEDKSSNMFFVTKTCSIK